MTTKTLRGPLGLTIHLDSAEIFPDDPGQGTPAIVRHGKHTATFWCALNEGELDCGEYELNASQQHWLEAQEDEVSAFIEAHS